MSQSSAASKPSSTPTGKPADYVYFDRTSAGFSDDAVPRAKAAQLKLEHFYKVAVDAAIERNTRSVLLRVGWISWSSLSDCACCGIDVSSLSGGYKRIH